MNQFVEVTLWKYVITFVIMLFVVLLARLILRFIPEGRLKRLLTRRIGP